MPLAKLDISREGRWNMPEVCVYRKPENREGLAFSQGPTRTTLISSKSTPPVNILPQTLLKVLLPLDITLLRSECPTSKLNHWGTNCNHIRANINKMAKHSPTHTRTRAPASRTQLRTSAWCHASSECKDVHIQRKHKYRSSLDPTWSLGGDVRSIPSIKDQGRKPTH